MKTNKDQVYDLLCNHYAEGQSRGATTQLIAAILGIQRPNVSAILNALVQEGLVCKTSSRPVLYYAKPQKQPSESCFENLIGYDGSLKHAVQLAKAAVLYPQGSLNTLILGAYGTGKKLLSLVIYQYALNTGVIASDAPYRVLDCRQYGPDGVQEELFAPGGVYSSTSGGILILDSVHVLDSQQTGLLLDELERRQERQDSIRPPMVLILADSSAKLSEEMRKRLPITIELPPLKQRPLEERFALVQNLLVLEAARAHRVISVNAELMRCLLLYETEINIASLKYDVKVGCANAYVREHSISSKSMNLYIGDFENYVRKGFLNYRAHREEIERIIPVDYSYRFDEHSFKMTAIDRGKLQGKTMYDTIDRRARHLAKQGISDDDIGLVLMADLEAMYRTYQSELTDKVSNNDQLSRLVDSRIITIVRDFLEKASRELGEAYPTSVFHGLCLHLDTTLKNGSKTGWLSEIQIREMVENYKLEYGLCMQLAATIENAFEVRLPSDEVVLLTMFISYKATPTDTSHKPVVLYAMQGAGLAAAYAALINQSLKLDNTFHFEIPLGGDPMCFYNDLRDYIRQIDRGCGVIVFYDSELMNYIFETIEAELGIQLRRLYNPFTGIALDVSRTAAVESDIDLIYNRLNQTIEQINKPRSNVIVTLCTTGIGGAVEIKRYIENYGAIEDTRVIAFGTASREALREDLGKVMERANIQCVVGTHDPGMFGIPFIPVSEVFSSKPEELPLVLNTTHRVKKQEMGKLDFAEIYSYLDESLDHLDVGKLKNLLPRVLEDINTHIMPLSFDTEIGLFLHIPCSIERVLAKGEAQRCIQKSQILSKYNREYKKLLKILKPLERAYRVIFTDDELAILLTIIYKL